jgi:hypothetical protein
MKTAFMIVVAALSASLTLLPSPHKLATSAVPSKAPAAVSGLEAATSSAVPSKRIQVR